MKRTTKVLSLLLAWMLLFNSMVFSAVSEEALPVETETASDMSAVIDEKYEAGDEIVEWSEEGVKHYYLGDGKYQAVVRADEGRLQSSSVQTTSKSSTTVKSDPMPFDTHISSAAQSTNYGDVDGVRVSTVAIGLFYHFDINLPANSNILYSTFNFAYYYNVSSGYLTVGTYAVEEYWDEYEVTWDDMEVYPNMGISTSLCGSTTLTASSTCNVTNPTWASVDITDIVHSWYSGERSNEGIALKRTGGTNNSVIIKSYESEQETYYSYYTITYTLMDEEVVPDGEYYLKNVHFEKFAEIDDNASATDQGAITEIANFNADKDQRWNIVYLYNGYYKITSTISEKALTAPTTIDAAITQMTYTGSNRQQWKITQNANGSYKISPRSNDSYYISAGSGSITENGKSIQMRESQSDEREDWNFIIVSEYIHWSFDTRIYYDATVEYSESYMKYIYEIATAAFVDKFNIEFKSPTVAYSSLLDVSADCSYAQDPAATCTDLCGSFTSCDELHHKSSNRLNTLLVSKSYFTYRLVGYALCFSQNGKHTSVVVGSGHVRGQNATTSTLITSNLAVSIQHELTHNLGRPDHCSDGQLCVFQGNLGYWCDACAQYIMDRY